MKLKAVKLYLIAGLCSLSLNSCLADPTEDENSDTDKTDTSTPNDNKDITDDFDTNSQTINMENTVTIHFENNTVTIDNPYAGKGIEINKENAGVTITSTITSAEVNYILSGNTSDGFIKIYSDYKFGLVLNGVSITNTYGPAINIQSGKKATITLVDKTSNRLIDGGSYPTSGNEDMKAALFSEGQLIFGGNGNLLVYGSRKHAICSDDYIRINTGTISIPRSISDGMHANEYVEINGGTLEMKPSGDGIDCEKGYVTINGGKIQITIGSDGCKAIKSTGDMTIAGGELSLTISGKACYDATDKDIKSAAGIKCDANLVISGNSLLTITASGAGGKGISADGTITFNGGTTQVTTSGGIFRYGNDDTAAKAIKSDGNLTVNSGTITIKTSQSEAEGMESKNILTINGGNIEIEAYDDCINASNNITINGGNIYCLSATNDGIDSNGTLTITGGVIVSAGASAPEEGFDCDQNRFSITGGTLVGIGGGSSTPTTSACTQRSLLYGASLSSGSILHIESAAGVEILTFKLPKASTTMLFSSPQLAAGTSYNIYTGGSISGGSNFHGLYSGATYTKGTSTTSFTSSSMVTTVGNVSEGPGGGPGGGGPRGIAPPPPLFW